jgi:hypothetical protein
LAKLTKVDAGGEVIATGLLLADIEDLKLTLCAKTWEIKGMKNTIQYPPNTRREKYG